MTWLLMETHCTLPMHDLIVFGLDYLIFQAGTKPGIGSGPATRGRGQRGLPFAIEMLGPPINKLTFLKTAAFVLNFELYPTSPPPDKRLAPLSRLLCRRLCISFFKAYRSFDTWALYEIAYILYAKESLRYGSLQPCERSG